MNRSEYLGIRYFVHPIPLAAVGVLILNDHFLKTHWSIWLTGKLSDFAGLFFFPLFLCAVICLTANAIDALRAKKSTTTFSSSPRAAFWITPVLLLACVAVTDLVFVAIKLSGGAADLYTQAMGWLGFPSAVTHDPTDLLALLMNPLTYLYARPFFSSSE